MRTRDGLTVMDHATFTQDVEGQIARRKLRLGNHEPKVRALLPAIEAAMAANGIAYEHSGLNGVASGQLAVVRVHGLLHRLSISAAPRWEPDRSPRLYAGSSWCGDGGATGDLIAHLELADATPEGIAAFLANYAARAATETRVAEDET